jgi:hypothetical protein
MTGILPSGFKRFMRTEASVSGIICPGFNNFFKTKERLVRSKVMQILPLPLRFRKKFRSEIMTRWLVMSFLLAVFFITALLYVARPEIFEHKAAEISAPIKQFIDDREAKRIYDSYQITKEESFKNWMKKYELPAGCADAKSSGKENECQKNREEYISQFEIYWKNRLSKPN